MILQGAEGGCGQMAQTVRSAGAQLPATGAAILWGAQNPPPLWPCHLEELKEKVIGNGFP